jgi:hypothetical protein
MSTYHQRVTVAFSRDARKVTPDITSKNDGVHPYVQSGEGL